MWVHYFIHHTIYQRKLDMLTISHQSMAVTSLWSDSFLSAIFYRFADRSLFTPCLLTRSIGLHRLMVTWTLYYEVLVLEIIIDQSVFPCLVELRAGTILFASRINQGHRNTNHGYHPDGYNRPPLPSSMALPNTFEQQIAIVCVIQRAKTQDVSAS